MEKFKINVLSDNRSNFDFSINSILKKCNSGKMPMINIALDRTEKTQVIEIKKEAGCYAVDLALSKDSEINITDPISSSVVTINKSKFSDIESESKFVIKIVNSSSDILKVNLASWGEIIHIGSNEHCFFEAVPEIFIREMNFHICVSRNGIVIFGTNDSSIKISDDNSSKRCGFSVDSIRKKSYMLSKYNSIYFNRSKKIRAEKRSRFLSHCPPALSKIRLMKED